MICGLNFRKTLPNLPVCKVCSYMWLQKPAIFKHLLSSPIGSDFFFQDHSMAWDLLASANGNIYLLHVMKWRPSVKQWVTALNCSLMNHLCMSILKKVLPLSHSSSISCYCASIPTQRIHLMSSAAHNQNTAITNGSRRNVVILKWHSEKCCTGLFSYFIPCMNML